MVLKNRIVMTPVQVNRTTKELNWDEIKSLVEGYAEAARRVKDAGFDLVEVHGAHGYLVSQFLSPLSNIRRDANMAAARRTGPGLHKKSSGG